MVDSQVVLNGQTIAYTCYAIVMILLVGWFGFRVTRTGRGNKVSHALFYSFTGLLVVLGVSLHIITFNTIPWASMDINRDGIKPDKVFDISVENHQFRLPSEKLVVNVDDKVLFNVTSADLTYGFGLFRTDNSMLFQMQVVPGHRNDILWQFSKPGVYTIRSTEYSGPKGAAMILKDAVKVVAR
ncbi:MAG: cytochrome C oxidase subunit II [Porphyromonadaceae bacterium]|nr:MAG: cytochrome C oxidase subunit II [Porphyromonadaceae bacterium]